MTVAVIREAAIKSQNFYSVRKLVEDICQDIRSKDYVSEALAIFNHVCSHTRYMRDPRTVELVKAPYLYVEEIRAGRRASGDCDDLSALICAMLMMAGCECRVVTVAFRNQFFNGQRQYSHVFAQAKEPRTCRWITLDPVPVRAEEMMRKVVAAKVWPVG